MLYGVHEMGVPGSCCRHIVSMINIHYKRVTHSPVHLTHENTTDFFTRLAIPPPWTHIADHHSKLTTTLANKIQSLMEPAEPHQDVCTLSRHIHLVTCMPMFRRHPCLRPLWPALSVTDTLHRWGCQRNILDSSIRFRVSRKTSKRFF